MLLHSDNDTVQDERVTWTSQWGKRVLPRNGYGTTLEIPTDEKSENRFGGEIQVFVLCTIVEDAKGSAPFSADKGRPRGARSVTRGIRNVVWGSSPGGPVREAVRTDGVRGTEGTSWSGRKRARSWGLRRRGTYAKR